MSSHERDSSSEPVVPRPSVRQWLILALKVLVSGGLLYLLLSRVDLGQLWQVARTASWGWLAAALLIYFVMIIISAWRWGLLLEAQHVQVPVGRLVGSFLVATFFNNFLPSNIGGDVVRIRDTAAAAGSKTKAAMIVLVDRGIGLFGLIFVAAAGASRVAAASAALGPFGPSVLWTVLAAGIGVSVPMVLMPERVAQLLRPLERLHRASVERLIERLTTALARFRAAPVALVKCFVGAIAVQLTIVGFYAATARGLAIPISLSHLAVLIPLSFIVQMAPVSVNGFGVREATFTVYFSRIGLPIESALALSFMAAALLMVFSISGAVLSLTRRQTHAKA